MHTGIHPLMREPVAQAEIRYRSEEEKGHWHEWRPVNADSVPPWWYAGADYTWEVVLAFVDAFMQHTWATDFDSEVERELLETAGDTFAEKLIHYESGQHRKPQFVSFVRVQLAARRAKLTRERWQKAAPPQPQTERAIANGAAVRALPGPVPTVVETAYAQSSPADVLGTVAGTAGELAAPGVEGREARKVLRDAYKAECKKAGVKVTDEMIAKTANPHTATNLGWTSRANIQKWLACHPKYDGRPDRMIRKVFSERPHLPKAQP